jgi:hypothetical protein
MAQILTGQRTDQLGSPTQRRGLHEEYAMNKKKGTKRETTASLPKSPRRMRESTLSADRQVFRLDAKRWHAFVAALDAPPKARPRLARLLNEPSILD